MPGGEHAIEPESDAEDAAWIEQAHDLDALLPVALRARAGPVRSRVGYAGAVERLDEALVLLVGRELDYLGVDQLLVDRAARREIVEVVVELGVAQHER